MKRVVNWFNKKKKCNGNAHDLAPDSVPEPPRNIPRYAPKSVNLFRTLNADDCCSSNNKTSNEIFNGIIESEEREEPQNTNNNDGNFSAVDSQSQHITGEVVEIERPISSDLLNNLPRLPVVNHESPSLNEPDSLNGSSSVSLTRSGSGDNMAVQDANSTHEIPKKLTGGDRKTGGNTYVITINKSTNFHIGTQKTINYPVAEDNTGHQRRLQCTNVGDKKLIALNRNQVLDIKDRLSEDDLVQIALSVRDKWQAFARNLGIEQSTINELEELNDSDYNLIVYDVLKQYLSRYPETTVGFMVNILSQSNEVEAIRKLTEKR